MHDEEPIADGGVPRGAAGSPRPRGRWAAIAIAAIAAAVIWPWILADRDEFPQKSHDHDNFHVPLVRAFADQWPAIDLSDYLSATGPGYHLLLASAAQVVGDGETTLQMLSSLCGIGLLATVAWRLGRWRRSDLEGVLLTLPLAASPYLLGNSIWLMTDNLSLWLLAIPLLGASLLAATPSRLGRWGLAAAGACVVRQINLWVLAPIALAAWFAAWRDGRRGGTDGARSGFSLGTLAIGLAACLPAIAVVAGFARLWGGLTPPSFQDYHAVSVQPAAVPFGLTLLAVYGAPAWIPIAAARCSRGPVPRWFAIATALGWAVFVVAGNSFAGLEVGRNGGWLWTLVARTPAPGGISSVLAIGSIAGVVLLMQLVALAFGRGRACGHGAIVAVAGLAAFLVAHVANKQLFQRYFDAPVLLVLAVLIALAWPAGERGPTSDPRADRTWIVALAAMVAMQVAFATETLFLPLAGR